MKRYATNLFLAPASTSCRPPCGTLLMVETKYDDDVTGPNFSMGCRTGPAELLACAAGCGIVMPLSSVQSSCSVSAE